MLPATEAMDKLMMIARMHQLGHSMEEKIQLLQEQSRLGLLNVSVVGQMKRGKSTIINVLLKEEILPSGVVPVTSVITAIRHGDSRHALVEYLNGDQQQIDLQDLELYVAETANPANAKQVKMVTIYNPAHILSKGICLFDTPGVGSVFEHNTEIAKSFLERTDVVLFTFSVDTPLNQTELEYLDDISKHDIPILFILNKSDMVNAVELNDLLEFAGGIIKSKTELIEKPTILAISARQGLEAIINQEPEEYRVSGVPELEDFLLQQLAHKKDDLLLTSIENRTQKIAQTQLNMLQLQKNALLTPLQQLNTNISEFQEFLQEIKVSGKEAENLLSAEVTTILQYYDELASGFQKQAILKVIEETNRLYLLHRHEGSKEVKEVLNNYLLEGVLAEIIPFREETGASVEKLFISTSYRFLARLQNIIKDIYSKASDLFGLVWEGEVDVPSLETRGKLEYKIGAQPLFYETSPSAFAGKLPGVILNRLIYKEVKNRIPIDIDRNCGVIRHYYLETLKSGSQQLKEIMSQMVEEAVNEISMQLEIAVKQKQGSEEEIQQQVAMIDQQIQELQIISKQHTE